MLLFKKTLTNVFMEYKMCILQYKSKDKIRFVKWTCLVHYQWFRGKASVIWNHVNIRVLLKTVKLLYKYRVKLA